MDHGVFASLIDGNQIPRLVKGIEAAVLKSFEEDRKPGRIILVTAAPRITAAEVRRRSEKCVQVFKVLRGDLKWSLDKIIDHLAPYLRAELDGTSWEPAARATVWTTG